jgi:cardiolipin synthase (CMP-forming)
VIPRQLRTTPNQLTLLRLVFIPFIVNSITYHHYNWALALFLVAGVSDGLDGMLARMLKQRTLLGEYLDPIVDKLLLSTLFIELSVVHWIPWRVTVMVFTRDVFILIIAAVLYIAAHMREFRPSIFGKLNTLAQIVTVFVVLLALVWPAPWLEAVRKMGLRATVGLTVISGLHYAWRTSVQLRAGEVRSAGA